MCCDVFCPILGIRAVIKSLEDPPKHRILVGPSNRHGPYTPQAEAVARRSFVTCVEERSSRGIRQTPFDI